MSAVRRGLDIQDCSGDGITEWSGVDIRDPSDLDIGERSDVRIQDWSGVDIRDEIDPDTQGLDDPSLDCRCHLASYLWVSNSEFGR